MSGTYHSEQQSLDCGERVNKNVCDLDDRRIVRAPGNARELNMSDGLIMKGSPPSSGRRTSGKQPVVETKAASRAVSSPAASAKTPAVSGAKARIGARPAKGAHKTSASAGHVAASKVAKPVNGRPAKPAVAERSPAKPSATKQPAPMFAAAKAPEIPAKAGAATKLRTNGAPVKGAVVDFNSGVKMKGNSAPDKSAKTTRSGADRHATSATVVVLKPQAAGAPVVLPGDYKPTEAEPFMNPMQRQYFRLKLLNWKEEILRQTRETLQGMHEDNIQYADLADRATSETDRALELRARDRQRKLISKIDSALARIEDGTYGYCEETGEPIGLKRLDARPIATLSLEAQERHERRERVHRGD